MTPEEYKVAHDLGTQMLNMCKEHYKKSEDIFTAAHKTAEHFVESGIMRCSAKDLAGQLVMEMQHHIRPNGELIDNNT